jgi:hypothetical protein
MNISFVSYSLLVLLVVGVVLVVLGNDSSVLSDAKVADTSRI